MTTLSPHAPDLDVINRRTWQARGTVRTYERLSGWTDPGERAALAHVAGDAREHAILDIGVGAGRTTPLLRALSSDYVGIDYTPEMVRAARAKHPGVRIEHMDARDLSAFEDGRFGLVVFSFNGIDSVDVADRRQVLREVHRVLRPGGLFVMSAHNRLGPGAGEQPRLHLQLSWNPLKLAWRALRLAHWLPRAWRNHRRYRALNETHDEWAIMNAGAHEFGIVVVYTTLAEQKRQLRQAGLRTEVVFDSTRGEAVREDQDTRDAWWFHYVARKA